MDAADTGGVSPSPKPTHTPARQAGRIPDDLWEPFRTATLNRGEKITDAFMLLMRAYTEVPDEAWEQAKQRAAERRESVDEVMARAVTRYGARK